MGFGDRYGPQYGVAKGLLRLRVKVPKKDTANTVKPTARRGRKPKAVETPPPPPVPAYEPPKDLIPPNVLKRVKGKRREWKAPTRREETQLRACTVPVLSPERPTFHQGSGQDTSRITQTSQTRQKPITENVDQD